MYTFSEYFTTFGLVPIDFFFKVIPAVFMLSWHHPKRSKMPLRILISVLVLLVLSFFITSYYYKITDFFGMTSFQSSAFLLMLMFIYLLQLFFFKASYFSLLFDLLGGYSLNQIVLLSFYLFCYQIPYLSSVSTFSFEYYLYQLIWFSVAYAIAYYIYIKKYHTPDSMKSPDFSLFLSTGILMFLMIFNMARVVYVETRSIIDYMCIICLIMCYWLILLFRGGFLKKIASEQELALTKKVWEEKEKSLRTTQEAINTINIKYHDLKHFLRRLDAGEDTRELVSEVANSLLSYEKTIVTGNDTLDMVLTEQTLRYNRNSVNLQYFADGALLSFLSTTDIISLFSNALDNAFEAVSTLDPDRREVHLTVKDALGMLYIEVQNPYSTEIIMQDGVPVTSKADKQYHGFGIRSIRQTTEKYGGNMTILTDNGWFRLKLLIPLP